MTQSMRPVHANAEAIADFLTASHRIPPEVLDQARKCIADSVAVTFGANDQGAGHAARSMASSWRSQGKAPMLFGGHHAAAPAAFVNGTFGHCLDFDDTHFGSLAHLSNPTWAAALAAGCDAGTSAEEILIAFLLGFEVGARLGQGELGQNVTKRGIHSTAIFGRLAATAAASRIMKLPADGVINAMGAAATQCIGLVASFGTMSKPLHAGKGAMDGVLSAGLAAHGFVARPDLLETAGETLAKALVQDQSVKFPKIEFDGNWEILQDTFKPYAACNLTHATIDTAKALAERVKGRAIERVVAHVHPTTISFAGKADPQTPLEGKFSNAYCTALGLLGYAAQKADFEPPRLGDPAIRDLLRKVENRADAAQTQTSAIVSITFHDGETIEARTPLASGNPGNPLTWAHMEQKFIGLAEPVIGRESRELFQCCRAFGEGDTLKRLVDVMADQTKRAEATVAEAAQ